MTDKEIRLLREGILRVTRDQFADALGVSAQGVYLWEDGTNVPTEANRVILGQMWHLCRDLAKAIGVRACVLRASQKDAAPPARKPESSASGEQGMRAFGLGDLMETLFAILPRWMDLKEEDIPPLKMIGEYLDAGGFDAKERLPDLPEGHPKLEERRSWIVDASVLAQMLMEDCARVLEGKEAQSSATRSSALADRAMTNLRLLEFLPVFCAASDKKLAADEYYEWCGAWERRGPASYSAWPFKPKPESKKGKRHDRS